MTASTPAPAAARPAHGLTSPKAFFAAICPLLGTLSVPQVEGIEAKLAAFATQGSPIAYDAYGLAHCSGKPARECSRCRRSVAAAAIHMASRESIRERLPMAAAMSS